jgi:hypothetical protein
MQYTAPQQQTQVTQQQQTQQQPAQASQHVPYSTSIVSTDEHGQIKNKRGRPRKYFDDETRRAAEYLRRKRSKNDNESGAAGDSPLDLNAPNSLTQNKKEERRPYLHYQMDYGNYDSSKPDAMTARDIVVNWLATGTNFADWLEWPMERRNEVAVELRDELKSHGMLDRDSVSIKQQVSRAWLSCVMWLMVGADHVYSARMRRGEEV